MNETRNTESQISTRGLDSEMEKKMNKKEYNTIVKAVEGLIEDTGYTNKMTLKEYGKDYLMMFDTERGIWLKGYSVKYLKGDSVKVSYTEKLSEKTVVTYDVSVNKNINTNNVMNYWLSIRVLVNGKKVALSSKNTDKLAVKDIQFIQSTIFNGLV